MRTLPFLLAGAIAILGHPPTAGADSPQPYALEKDSEFQYGCFGPCACPILIRTGVEGTFLLSPRGFDGLYFVYDVLDVRWQVPAPDRAIPVTGSGTYKIGGEVAIQEQLALTLSVDGGAPRLYDSGLVAKTNEFPAIDLDLPSEGFTCFDTLFHVHASPQDVTSATGRFRDAISALGVRPNPLLVATAIEFELARAERVTLTVFDLRGRIVARLIDQDWMEAGPHLVPWEGRGDRGAPIPAGAYVVEIRAGSERAVTRAIKLQHGAPGRVPFLPH